MPTITLPDLTGPKKGDIIDSAFEECGRAGFVFDTQPEEKTTALRRLNALMYELRDSKGIDLGYDFPLPGTLGSGSELSGIPWSVLDAVVTMLALRIAPAMGKTLSPESKAAFARSTALLQSVYASIPTMELAGKTPLGQGNRWGTTFSWSVTTADS
jgi:hypothetical protein